MKQTFGSSNARQKMDAENEHYHAEKLGMGRLGAHEGWTKAEEVVMNAKSSVSADTRQEMIAVAAYYLAEKRGFIGQECLQDWIKAEAGIDAMLH